jgi:hypothetical protein
MSLLETLGTGQGYLKAGFLGFQKSGKTWTAALLAAGTRHLFKLPGPVAMYDTENGSEYVAPLVLKTTGLPLVGHRGRSFDDLVKMAEECVAGEVSVLIVDSITHVWRELCDAYMKQLNEQLAQRKRPLRRRLEFQDWAHVKGIWQRWADLYVNAPLHIIICGRAGFEYAMEDIEDDRGHTRKELVKTGIKMKVEGEFGFEPSLLVEMEREQEPDGEGGFTLRRRATVLGDRFGIIDGATTLDPTYDFFAPHVGLLKPGTHATVDTAIKTETGVDDEGDTEWQRERKTREILAEEITGLLVKHGLDGQGKEEKSRRLALLESVFSTRSWTAITSRSSDHLRAGLEALRAQLDPANPVPSSAVDPDPERAELLRRIGAAQLALRLSPERIEHLERTHLGIGTVETADVAALNDYLTALQRLDAAEGKAGGRRR